LALSNPPMTIPSKVATLLLPLFVPCACGGSSDSTSTTLVPPQTVAESCALEKVGCPAANPVAVGSTDLTPTSSAVTFRISADAYWQAAPAHCPGTFLVEIQPDKLTGSRLQIESVWDGDQATTDANGVDACTRTKADVVVYGRSSTGEAWRVVDFRTLAGTLGDGAVCNAEVVDHGPGETGLPNDGVSIWLTPGKYPGGLRVSIVAAAACNPLPIVVKVAEEFG